MELPSFYRWENWELKWVTNLEVPLISNGKTSPPTYLPPNPHEKTNFRFINLWELLKQPSPKVTYTSCSGWLQLLKPEPVSVPPRGLVKTSLGPALSFCISKSEMVLDNLQFQVLRWCPCLWPLCDIDIQHLDIIYGWVVEYWPGGKGQWGQASWEGPLTLEKLQKDFLPLLIIA